MFCTVIAQNNNEQLELKIENDKLVLVDKYYTSGFFMTYKKNLQNNFIFKKTDDTRLQLHISLGNQTYTPTNLASIDTRDFDRPYAGWLFATSEIGKINSNSALFVGVEAGITGEESLSGKLQTFIHNAFNIETPTWTEEIAYKFLVNLKAKYIKRKTIGKSHALNFIIESALGTKDIFVENSLGYVFGRFNPFHNSSVNGFIDSTITNEFFGFFNIAHRYVIHNTLIQGSLNYDDVLFTTNIERHVFKFNIGTAVKFKRNALKLIFNFNTKETPKSSSHSYGTLSFSRTF